MALEVRLYDLLMAFSRMLDQVMPALAGHHLRVGFLADKLAVQLHLPPEERRTIFVAAMLHDVGAIPLRSGINDLIFELDFEAHARASAYLLTHCPPLQSVADAVRYHHIRWNHVESDSDAMRMGCLIGVADRVDILLRSLEHSDFTTKKLITRLKSERGERFAPLHVDAMCDILQDSYLDTCLCHRTIPLVARDEYPELWGAKAIRDFSVLFGHIIDSCSPFTATHSTGVGHTAQALGQLTGMNATDLDTLFVAGMLHDIGKLGVPPDLLERPGPLTAEELPGMQHHAFLSQKWLDAIPGFEKQVSPWGALHHERLNGTGYPHGLTASDLSSECRIMAIADVFTAITEDRPYRAGMPLVQAMDLLQKMQKKGGLDADLVALLSERDKQFHQLCSTEQEKARQFFLMTREHCQATNLAN